MRAPVYRHVEAESTIGGLSMNGLLLVLGIAFPAIYLLSTLGSLAVIFGTYVVLRLLSRGRPASYWQHWILHHVRGRTLMGRVSAMARTRAPQFPFGPYRSRDVQGEQKR